MAKYITKNTTNLLVKSKTYYKNLKQKADSYPTIYQKSNNKLIPSLINNPIIKTSNLYKKTKSNKTFNVDP